MADGLVTVRTIIVYISKPGGGLRYKEFEDGEAARAFVGPGGEAHDCERVWFSVNVEPGMQLEVKES